jgi:hypothetical protein
VGETRTIVHPEMVEMVQTKAAVFWHLQAQQRYVAKHYKTLFPRP